MKDYFKKGILFKDIIMLFNYFKFFNKFIDVFKKCYFVFNIDFIVGIEVRGFILGFVFVYVFGVGFVFVRKKGKFFVYIFF